MHAFNYFNSRHLPEVLSSMSDDYKILVGVCIKNAVQTSCRFLEKTKKIEGYSLDFFQKFSKFLKSSDIDESTSEARPYLRGGGYGSTPPEILRNFFSL